MGLIVGYAMTLFGLIFAGVWDFLAMAVLLTVIGVVITLIHDVHNDYRRRGYLITLGIHALIWFLFRFSPDTLTTLLGLAFWIPVGILLAVLAVFWMSDFLGGGSGRRSGGSGREEESASEFDISRLPSIVYDDENREWRKLGKYGDHVDYRNKNGDTVTIYAAQISGTSATTSAGNLHWY